MDDPIDPSCSVMTVLGPIKGEELGSVLMNEYLICDSSKRSKLPMAAMALASTSTTSSPPQGTITMETLAAVKAHPFHHVENMTLSSRNDATAELQKCNKNIGTILDVTTVAGGRDIEAARALSQTLGIHVVLGTSCQSSNNNNHDTSSNAEVEASQQDIEAMEQELLYGIELSQSQSESQSSTNVPICAGFIGPVEISSQFAPSELRELKAAAVVQKLTNAPLMVAEATPTKHALQILDHIVACDGRLSRTIVSHTDHYVQDSSFLQQILQRGAILCFDRFSISSACFDPDPLFPTIRQVVDCIDNLLQVNPNYIHQLVLSSGVCMKLQYCKYGGMGFGALHDYLIPRLLAKGMTPAQIQIMTHTNPQRLLQWWKPPPPKQVPKEYIPCSVCKKMFEPILGEYYTKYTFTYCGTDCLRKHRQMKFKPLE